MLSSQSNFFVKNPAEAAGLLCKSSFKQRQPSTNRPFNADTSLTLPTPQAQLFACPIPAEYHAQGAIIQQAVEQAVQESREQGVDKRGKEVTPWLLKRVGELTQGKALQSSEFPPWCVIVQC